MSGKGWFLHLFTPHHTNNHRPKVLHIDALFVYVVVFAVLQIGFRTIHHTLPNVLGYATDIHVEALLTDTNAKRQAAGLAPLTLNSQLSEAAAHKAEDMFAKNYWAHNSPTGATPWSFIVGAGYNYVLAGENLAKNFSTSDAVVDAWMASPTHRDNILKPRYREIGFAVVNGVLNGEETTLVVQMFGTRPEQIAEAPKAPPVTTQTALETAKPQSAPAATPKVASAYSGVLLNPLVNISQVTRDGIFIFVGILLGVLAIDAWLVARRGTVRIVGHNIGHMLFFAALLIVLNIASRGSLL